MFYENIKGKNKTAGTESWKIFYRFDSFLLGFQHTQSFFSWMANTWITLCLKLWYCQPEKKMAQHTALESLTTSWQQHVLPMTLTGQSFHSHGAHWILLFFGWENAVIMSDSAEADNWTRWRGQIQKPGPRRCPFKRQRKEKGKRCWKKDKWVRLGARRLSVQWEEGVWVYKQARKPEEKTKTEYEYDCDW